MLLNPDKTHIDIAKRDLLRDFCLAAQCLEEQFRRLESSGRVSHSILTALLGNVSNKGLLWRLKDAAHHFCGSVSDPQARLLDWIIGCLFHECLQLQEAAYLAYSYAPRLPSLLEPVLAGVAAQQSTIGALRGSASSGAISLNADTTPRRPGAFSERLAALMKSGGNVLRMHAARTRTLLSMAVEAFCLMLAHESSNLPLARLLHERCDEIQAVFGPLSANLLAGVSGNIPGRLELAAACSYAAGGKNAEALRAAQQARVKARAVSQSDTADAARDMIIALQEDVS